MAECKAGMWKMIGRGTFVAFLDCKNSSTIPPIVATTGAVEPLSVRCLVHWTIGTSPRGDNDPLNRSRVRIHTPWAQALQAVPPESMGGGIA